MLHGQNVPSVMHCRHCITALYSCWLNYVALPLESIYQYDVPGLLKSEILLSIKYQAIKCFLCIAIVKAFSILLQKEVHLIYYLCCCSVTWSCLTLCDPRDCNTPGFPVLHHLLEFVQTLVHRVGDAIQPSPPLSSHSPPAFCLLSRSFPVSQLFI